jgi:EmrB/QacA subfamily drug resistance transporter
MNTQTTPNRIAVLRVMCIALMMVVAAVASLNVALPGIARDTGATQTQLQWIVDAYSLAFASLLLPAGALGDRFGRKPVLAAGLTVFGLASSLALLVRDPNQLIAIRVAMGVGAACVMPVTLSVITTVFPAEERGRAVGTWVGVAAGGGVLGLLASGLLLQVFSWPAVFALNIVMAMVALAGTIAVVPDTRDEHPPRLDPLGTLLSVAGLASLVYGIIEGPDRGWAAAATIVALGSGVALLSSFVVWELKRREPMLDPRNFLRRGFGAGSLSITIQFFAAFGFLFLAMPYLQLVMGFSPLHAAASMLPMALTVMPLSRVAPHIAARFGVRVTGAAGLLLMAAGLLVLSSLRVDSSYAQFALGLVPFGAGMALAGAPATTAIVASLPRDKQGIASAINDLSRELGGALGIAVLGSFLNDGYRSGVAHLASTLPPSLAGKATASLGAAEAIGRKLGAQGHVLVAQAQQSFVNGLGTSLTAGAATLVLGALFVAVRAPGRKESRANAGLAPEAALAPARS